MDQLALTALLFQYFKNNQISYNRLYIYNFLFGFVITITLHNSTVN